MNHVVILNMLIDYGIKIFFAVVTLFVGLFIIKNIIKLTEGIMKRNKMDVTLSLFMASIISISLKLMLFITVISMLGVQMTSFVALLGAAGLAIGLAFQGSLSNFASGILILIFRPFNVGDYIESLDSKGIVTEIQILFTVLKAENNKKIILPNSGIYSNIIAVYKEKPIKKEENV